MTAETESSEIKVLGNPLRYTYKANPVTLYVGDGDDIKPMKGWNIDFEVAYDKCDADSVSEERLHLINEVEPGLYGGEGNPMIEHSVFYTDEDYEKLKKVTNSSGRLHKYVGVVRGYTTEELSDFLGIDMVNTGLCITDDAVTCGLIKKPRESFNENKHMRNVQIAEAKRLRLVKSPSKTEVSCQPSKISSMMVSFG